ncbi:MAG TPA: response regulator [Bacilli bacterium]
MYKVLVVDDEPMIREGLVKLVGQSCPFVKEIHSAENGKEALEQLERIRPDFLLTDIRMPVMDGLELCRIVSEKYSQIQTVIVSGYDDFEYARKSLTFGVKDYILKPITKKGIRDTLQKLADHARKTELAYVSLAKWDEWIERMDQAVWMLNEAEADALIAEWRAEMENAALHLTGKIKQTEEMCALLRKRLNGRNLLPAVPEFRSDEPASDAALFGQLFAYIKDIMRRIKERRKGRAKDPFEEAKCFIDDHLSRDVSLQEVADYIGLNASYFSQLFKQTTGETFVQYRIKRRMERAKQLLADPRNRITDISFEVGYADHPHFTKTFKKMTGYTPSEYREMLGVDL